MELPHRFRCTEVLARTTRLLIATRRHYAAHGLTSTVNKAARWLQRRVWRTASSGHPEQTSQPQYRWPSPLRRIAAGKQPRAVLVGPLDKALWPDVTRVNSVDALLSALADDQIDVVVLAAVPWSAEVASALRQAFSRSVPTAYVGAAPDSNSDSAELTEARRKTMVACDVVLLTDPTMERAAHADRKPTLDLQGRPRAAIGAVINSWYVRTREPRVSIVTILYNKARELPFVLASYRRQSYPGEIEVVCVDDRSPDNSVEIVERFFQRDDDERFTLRLVRNERNVGNCESRNRGIAAASGDVLIVIDADCMLNRDFVQRHVDAHAFGDCEVVIGPMNIETMKEDPATVLQRYELHPACAVADSQLQDKRNQTSFLNCITRNFSIKRSALPTEPLFDSLFSYKADATSGFGWEDVEMGYRLYLAGARIKFAAEAISIHVSAPPAPETGKPARSLLNFERLLQKHPAITAIAPAWVDSTRRQILDWAAQVDSAVDERPIQTEPAADMRSDFLVVRGGPRRLRVLTYRWHVSHQYELWKLPIDVTMVTDTGTGMCNVWDYDRRPLPANATFRQLSEIDVADYDVAIVHFDENVLAPENTNGVIGPEWGAAFKLFIEQIDLPKIAVCHGTPQFHGQYTFDYAAADLMQPIEAERQRLVDYLGDVHVVCNSYQAQSEWQFRRSSVIWHGFDPTEFPPATYERGILSPLGALVMSRPHYRGYFLYRQVFDGHLEHLQPETLHVPEPHPGYDGNTYAVAKFRRYVDELRRYSVYFNPTLRSPMPRARAEPMMCGVVTVSARNHDVDRFIDNKVDGFYADNADELRDQMYYLKRHPDQVRRIGAAGRDKAVGVFHVQRYLDDWTRLLARVI